MGDRYILTVKCDCGKVDEDVYYAPTCGFTHWKCPNCGNIIDLEVYSGITYEYASNEELISQLIDSIHSVKRDQGLEKEYPTEFDVEKKKPGRLLRWKEKK